MLRNLPNCGSIYMLLFWILFRSRGRIVLKTLENFKNIIMICAPCSDLSPLKNLLGALTFISENRTHELLK